MDRSILRTGIPAAIVASVLGFSLLFPATASKANGHGDDNHGYGHKCGYGQVDDNDENNNVGDASALQKAPLGAVPQSVKDKEKELHDNDCNEDESDGGDGD
jgi:hypothetical protein